MAGCDVLYHDPAHADLGDGWRPCTAPGNVWTDPDQVLRFVCAPTAASSPPSTPPGWPIGSDGAGPAW